MPQMRYKSVFFFAPLHFLGSYRKLGDALNIIVLQTLYISKITYMYGKINNWIHGDAAGAWHHACMCGHTHMLAAASFTEAVKMIK